MRYWVMKGNPKWYDFQEKLRPGRIEDWHNYRVPKDLNVGHRVFFWESSPECRIVGLGNVLRPAKEKDRQGRWVFWVRYLTKRLSWMPDIDLLQSIGGLRDASFLKRGPKQTSYPLTEAEATLLYQVIVSGNPELEVWNDMSKPVVMDDITAAVWEGGPRLVAHILRERRDREIIRKKKQAFRARHGRLFCECCLVDLGKYYGPEAEDICEVHHHRQLSKAKKEVRTTLKDLSVLCPNCHRVIHRFSPMIPVTELAAKVKQANKAPELTPRSVTLRATEPKSK